MPDPDNDHSPTVVYIHGAGRQVRADKLKEELDGALFGGPGPSVVARYSQVVWGDEGLAANRERAIEAIATSPASAEVRGAQIVELTPPRPDFEVARVVATRATGMVATFLEQADEVQQQMSLVMPPAQVAALRFAFLAGITGSDVVGYLFLGWAPEMRQPVIDVLRNVRDPIVVIAHSLGTILGYDVLCRTEFAGRDIRLLLTAGSPLGLPPVQAQLNDGLGPGTLPGGIPLWSNWADPQDPIARLDRTLEDDFAPPPPPIADHPEVDNPRPNNHDLPGYLGLPAVRALVHEVVTTGHP